MTSKTIIKPGDVVWLVKYALSKEPSREVVDQLLTTHGCVFVNGRSDVYKIGGDVFATWNEAVAAMEAMRLQKIKNLEKQIAKLRALEWKEQK